MINWLSEYDYDFAIATIPVQIILLIFYSSRRNLPIRQSTSFSIVMVTNLIMTITDIISCEMNEIFTNFSLGAMYFINMLYFLAFVIRGWALFDYTAECCREHKVLDHRIRFLATLPLVAVVIMILITPWVPTIFTFDATGYHNSPLYQSIYACTYFYIFASYVNMMLCFNKLSSRIRWGLFSYNTILLLGLILRKQFYGKYLVTSYFSLLAILIIFITSENPDLYRDQKTKLFNKDAFDVIGPNYINRDLPFNAMILSVYNYDTAIELYGQKQLYDSLSKTGDMIIDRFPGYYVFYFTKGNFLLLDKKNTNKDQDTLVQEWKESFRKIRDFANDDISLTLSTMVIPYEMLKVNVRHINDLLDLAFESSFRENQQGNYLFNEALLKDLYRQKAVEVALNKALEEHTVDAYYQPIYSIKENRIIGAEALARLIDPILGYIPQLEFVAVAERNGDIMELGRQIFEKVCAFAQRAQKEQKDIEFINVNLSPAQCLNSMLASELSAIAAKYDVSMNMIDFEITETAAEDFLSIQKQIYLLQ
ncbi:MAG: EAL domain-containing protein, partial [Erysipelotrichaceae bacterium]|nr:EAL domain-containing protein [Erysipelotrichaceae bacterium]